MLALWRYCRSLLPCTFSCDANEAVEYIRRCNKRGLKVALAWSNRETPCLLVRNLPNRGTQPPLSTNRPPIRWTNTQADRYPLTSSNRRQTIALRAATSKCNRSTPPQLIWTRFLTHPFLPRTVVTEHGRRRYRLPPRIRDHQSEQHSNPRWRPLYLLCRSPRSLGIR